MKITTKRPRLLAVASLALLLGMFAIPDFSQTKKEAHAKSAKGQGSIAISEYWDVSGSLDPKAAEGVMTELENLAPLARRLPDLRRWQIFPWATEGDLMRPATAEVELPTQSKVNCQQANGESSFLRASQEEAGEKCAEKKKSAAREYASLLKAASGQARKDRSALNLNKGAPQTCFWHLLQHLLSAKNDSINVLVTDGTDQACGRAPEDLKNEPEAFRTFIVLVPSKSDASGKTNPVARTKEIRRRLSGVDVLWASDLDPQWNWLVSRLTAHSK